MAFLSPYNVKNTKKLIKIYVKYSLNKNLFEQINLFIKKIKPKSAPLIWRLEHFPQKICPHKRQ